MSLARMLGGTLAACVIALATASWAAGTPHDWMKRILDPTTIGVKPYPDSKINRKLTVDYLSKADPPRRIAIYMAPLDKMKEASKYFADTLHVQPAISGESSKYELRRFDLTGEGEYPPAAKGLTITITRSQFVDDKLQITMEYTPPGGK
jgi:hypothetical protein